MKNRILAVVAPFTFLMSGCGDVDSNMPDANRSPIRSIEGEHTIAFTEVFPAAQAIAPPPERASASLSNAAKPKSMPTLVNSFQGLSALEQRNAGIVDEQDAHPDLDVEPPDQALCVGNGFVLEGVNRAILVRDTQGQPLSAPVSLNALFDRPPIVDTGADPDDVSDDIFGPNIFDPTCYFDAPTQRWFVVAVTLERFGDGVPNGESFLELAVSTTSNPLGPWMVYDIQVDDDCGDGIDCVGDFPHIGADQHGIYVTTNQMGFPTSTFEGANVYAFSKQQFLALPPSVTMTLFQTKNAVDINGDNVPDQSGNTLWPATTPDNQYESDAGGTEYFLSSNSANEAPVPSDKLIVWALTNTRSLETSTPALALRHKLVPVHTYSIPPPANQKDGSTPLRDCLNDRTATECWRLFTDTQPEFIEQLSLLDSGDYRIRTLTYANNKLWGALNTKVHIGGEDRVGAAWFILDPTVSTTSVSASVIKQGVLTLENNNIMYPSIGVTKNGRGIMTFSLSGDDFWPSAAYAPIDAVAGVGPLQIAAAGLGPLDGLTGYFTFTFLTDSPNRFGDYGATATDGNNIWIASEYVAQTCDLNEYVMTSGSCQNTRTFRANWGTRISRLAVMGAQ